MSIGEHRRGTRIVSSVSVLSLVCLSVVLTAGACATDPFWSKHQNEQRGITKGPVLLRVYQERAALMWETETEGPCRLYYSGDWEPEKYVESTGEKVQYEIKNKGKETVKRTAFIHKVWLEDLDAGQVYKYYVTGPETRSKVYEFHTIPSDTDELRFVVYGDSRTNPETHRRLVELIIKQKVDFVVHSGDLVSRGDSYEQWGPQYFDTVKGLAETVPIYIAKGNHEGNNGNYEKLLIPHGQENSFGFDYGPVRYFCADSVSRGLRTKDQLKLITADAKASEARWKFVSYHVPSVNFGGHWSAWGYPDALPSLAKAGVDFVLTGHSHQYERFWPIAPPLGTEGGYVTYITTGGGGAPLYDVVPSLYHAKAEDIHHFCLFEIKGNKLTMDAIDIDGKIIDHLEIIKTNGRLNKQHLWTAVPMEGIRLHQKLHSVFVKSLSEKPEKNRPFTITYQLATPALSKQCQITLKLRCDEGTYQLAEPQTLTIPKEGGTVTAKLTVTPLVEVKVPKDRGGRARPIVPALWFDCHYKIGRIQETLSQPIIY